MKIAINTSYGGFRYPMEWEEKYGLSEYPWETKRNDPQLIKAIEENPVQAKEYTIRLVEIPNNYTYAISDYDGIETVYAAKLLLIYGKPQLKNSDQE